MKFGDGSFHFSPTKAIPKAKEEQDEDHFSSAGGDAASDQVL
jgi:hypothetical protein